MRISRVFVLLLAVGILAACEGDGPAEEAGERLDDIAGDLANEAEDACEEVKEEAGARDTDC